MRAPATRRRVPPPLIAIGGMDRAGKSIQRRALLDHLAAMGFSPVYRWSRIGYTRRVERAKRLLRPWKKKGGGGEGAGARRYPQRAAQMRSPLRRWLWTTVALLDLFWEYAVSLRLLRLRGRAVVCDRWLCDALVDLRVNFPRDRVEARLLWRLLERAALRPNASFLLVISPDESIRRARASGRRHVEPREVLVARLAEYERIAASGLGEAIDAERDPDAIASDLRERVDARMRGGDSGEQALAFRNRTRVAEQLPGDRS